MMHTKKEVNKGILYIVIGTFCFASMGVFVKLINNKDAVAINLFSRFSINILCLLPILIKDRSFIIKIRSPYKLVLRSLFGIISIGTAFYIVTVLSVADTILLNNTSALFVPLIVWVMYRLKTHFTVLIGSLIGFVGIILILNAGKELLTPISLLGIASGFFGGVAIVMIREITKTVSPQQSLFYFALSGMIISGLFLPFSWNKLVFDTRFILLLCCIGIAGTLYQLFLTLALKNAPVRLISALIFLSVFFGGIFDWLIWNIVPNLVSFCGMFLVILGAVTTIYFGKKQMTINKE